MEVFGDEYVDVSITTPKVYEVTIQGAGGSGILMNKMPDLSISKAEKKSQAKVDPTEAERLNWREKLYFREDGSVIIPGENIHESLKEGAAFWGMKIPGEGNKTYTNLVAASIIIEDADLGINKDSNAIIPFGKAVNGNPSKGKKSGCKVYKIRPLIRPWKVTFTMHFFDGRLSLEILRTIFHYAGTFKGLGDWRPTYGRYEIVEIKEKG